MKSTAIERLAEVLHEANVAVKFGLLAQGHMPTVEAMLAKGEPWDVIGQHIGWSGDAVRRSYVMELQIEAFRGGFDSGGNDWREDFLVWFEQRRRA